MALKLDPELTRQLMLTFKAELDEQLQAMTDGLLALEKGASGAEREKCMDGLFRAAHNIKGAARGVEVKDVAEIAHCLESLFSVMRREKATASAQTIDLCLRSLDRMREAMAAFESQTPLAFDLPALLERLNNRQAAAPAQDPKGRDEEARAEIHDAAPGALATREGAEVARVAVSKLDHVSALAEELLASKIQMADHLAEVQRLHDEARSFARKWAQFVPAMKRESALAAAAGTSDLLATATHAINSFSADSGRIYEQMRASGSRLGLISGTLLDQVRMMRLMPVATLLRPLARSVRDIAHELGKKLDYEVIGDEIEMDRPVLDGIKDPLVHLLRNAIDHGIESPQERRARGKPETGRLSVSVSGMGGRIVMTVQDDGAGISVAKIAQTAVRKKLLSAAEAEALSPAETLDLIFRPGFSSKEIITNVSGRGVGLDVVLSNLRSLKGSVRVDTIEGKGTTFTLSLPLTLSTDHGLLVRAAGSVFAIPSAAVERVMEIKASKLIDVEASQAMVFAGKAIPARDLSAVLELAQAQRKPASQEQLPVVVVSKGRQSVALLVEEIIGEREIVVKPLQPPLISIRNVTGGTLTGSGKVIVVLNPADLVVSALRLGSASRMRAHGQDDAVAQAPRILVVDDSITTRTLEKNILESQGYQVAVAVDGKLGWEAMQKEDFDLVVTDVEMPVMNGFELTAQIKGSGKFREIPVVIVTSLANESDRRRGVEVGADAYIVKSQFETKALLDVINQLI